MSDRLLHRVGLRGLVRRLHRNDVAAELVTASGAERHAPVGGAPVARPTVATANSLTERLEQAVAAA